MTHPNYERSKWNDEDRSRVAVMLKRGLSRREIALEMGITRSACGGRIHRDDDLRTVGPRRPPSRPKRVGSMTPPPSPPIPKPEMRRVPLKDLMQDECTWPVTTLPDRSVIGGYLFCGAETQPLGKWCPYHMCIGYVPPRERRHG
ncbi:GcrA family cell cycle regulator [Rhizobium ruizarguesonis]